VIGDYFKLLLTLPHSDSIDLRSLNCFFSMASALKLAYNEGDLCPAHNVKTKLKRMDSNYRHIETPEALEDRAVELGARRNTEQKDQVETGRKSCCLKIEECLETRTLVHRSYPLTLTIEDLSEMLIILNQLPPVRVEALIKKFSGKGEEDGEVSEIGQRSIGVALLSAFGKFFGKTPTSQRVLAGALAQESKDQPTALQDGTWSSPMSRWASASLSPKKSKKDVRVKLQDVESEDDDQTMTATKSTSSKSRFFNSRSPKEQQRPLSPQRNQDPLRAAADSNEQASPKSSVEAADDQRSPKSEGALERPPSRAEMQAARIAAGRRAKSGSVSPQG
jgi:hypothetical protein